MKGNTDAIVRTIVVEHAAVTGFYGNAIKEFTLVPTAVNDQESAHVHPICQYPHNAFVLAGINGCGGGAISYEIYCFVHYDILIVNSSPNPNRVSFAGIIDGPLDLLIVGFAVIVNSNGFSFSLFASHRQQHEQEGTNKDDE